MPKVGKEVLSRVICETSLKPWVILWLFELKGSGHQNVLTRSRLAGCMGGSGAKIGCGSQLSPQIHVPIFCSQKSNTCLAPGLRWLSVLLVKHIKAIKTHLWQCSKGPFPHLTFLSWDFVTHGTFKTFNNNNKNLSLVLNYKWILFCRKRSEKDFVCLSVESPVSQWLSLVCHILTSLYLPPPRRCWHSPCSWYLGTTNPTPPSFPWVFHPSFPVALEATSLMGTVYLYPVPYQIVDTKRYPRNENIFLLLTLTLAYMDRHLYPRWDKQLLWVCVGGCECLWVSASADRCIK